MADEQLPIAGFDELPLNTLQHRIRSLTSDQLELLLAHEQEHADRVQVVELLNNRLEELAAGAEPTPGEGEPIDVPGRTAHGSPVGPQGPREKGRPGVHGTRSSTGKGAEHKSK
ncbi:hypothetical protein [Salinifilum ghardaiensis]